MTHSHAFFCYLILTLATIRRNLYPSSVTRHEISFSLLQSEKKDEIEFGDVGKSRKGDTNSSSYTGIPSHPSYGEKERKSFFEIWGRKLLIQTVCMCMYMYIRNVILISCVGKVLSWQRCLHSPEETLVEVVPTLTNFSWHRITWITSLTCPHF